MTRRHITIAVVLIFGYVWFVLGNADAIDGLDSKIAMHRQATQGCR